MVDGGEAGVDSRDEGKHTRRNDLLFVEKMMWKDLDSTGVTEIGWNLLGFVGRGTFGIGVMAAVFHCCGTYGTFHYTIRYDTRCYFNVRSKADISQLDWLNSRASGAANIGAPRRRNHAGMPSSPVAVGFSVSSSRNT